MYDRSECEKLCSIRISFCSATNRQMSYVMVGQQLCRMSAVLNWDVIWCNVMWFSSLSIIGDPILTSPVSVNVWNPQILGIPLLPLPCLYVDPHSYITRIYNSLYACEIYQKEDCFENKIDMFHKSSSIIRMKMNLLQKTNFYNTSERSIIISLRCMYA